MSIYLRPGLCLNRPTSILPAKSCLPSAGYANSSALLPAEKWLSRTCSSSLRPASRWPTITGYWSSTSQEVGWKVPANRWAASIWHTTFLCAARYTRCLVACISQQLLFTLLPFTDPAPTSARRFLIRIHPPAATRCSTHPIPTGITSSAPPEPYF